MAKANVRKVEQVILIMSGDEARHLLKFIDVNNYSRQPDGPVTAALRNAVTELGV